MKRLFYVLFVIAFLLLGCKHVNIAENNVSVNLVPISSIPAMPFIYVNKNPPTISAAKMEAAITKYAKVEWLAEDQLYFLPSKANMEVIITYLDEMFRKFGVHYIPEGTDCDDFARLKTALSKLILSQSYDVEASPAVFTIFVFQKKPWASVPAGGGHALIAYACVDENNENKIYVWEPQSTETIAASNYPNKDQLFYVGDEMASPPSPTEAK